MLLGDGDVVWVEEEPIKNWCGKGNLNVFTCLFLVLSPHTDVSVRIAQLTHSLQFDNRRQEAERKLQAVSQAVMKLVSVE